MYGLDEYGVVISGYFYALFFVFPDVYFSPDGMGYFASVLVVGLGVTGCTFEVGCEVDGFE